MNQEQWILIENEKELNNICNIIKYTFHFDPKNNHHTCPFRFPRDFDEYSLVGTLKNFISYDKNDNFIITKQTKIIKDIFVSCMEKDDFMYAIDWHHSIFKYNPRINEPYDYYMMYNTIENTKAYFPSFYPDGDFYFFVAKDFSWGYFTHPWQNKVWIYGDILRKLIKNQAIELGFVYLG